MTQPTDEQMDELADWVATRPAAVREIMDRFPPACYVVAKPGRKLIAPAPGVTGQVVSYQHDEETDRVTLNVEAADGLVPIMWKAECDPDWLDVVESDEQRALYERAKEMRRR